MKIGRNDPCWCGSGRKYKKCHLNRENEQSLPFGAIADALRKSSIHQTCMHPKASPQTCGKVVSGHTLQRSRVLKAIADNKKHILTFYPQEMEKGGLPKVHSRGWRRASTFSAFCDKHDDETFSPLEKSEFTGSEEQNFLIGYRAVCWELFQKIGATKALPKVRNLIDRGVPPEIQRVIQESIDPGYAGFLKGLEDFSLIKSEMDLTLMSRDFSQYDSCKFTLDFPMKVAATGAISPNQTLSGKVLQDMGNFQKLVQCLPFGVDVGKSGVSYVFVWRKKEKAPEGYMAEVLALNKIELPRFLTQFFFGFYENTYFSSEWWGSLGGADRNFLSKLMSNSNPYYDPPEFDLTRNLGEEKFIDFQGKKLSV